MQSAAEWDVVVVGELYHDEILAEFGALPKLGEEAFARQYKREIGGGAAITAMALAKLGVRVALLGYTGEDGDWLRERLRSFGIGTEYLETNADEPTGLTVSVSTREDRAFFSYYGANELLAAGLRRAEWSKVMARARHVHFAMSPDGKLDGPLFAALKKQKVRISVDVQSNLSWLTDPASAELLKTVDLFMPNEQEAEWASGETGIQRILRGLRDLGIRRAAVKLGGKGAALLWDKKEYLVDAFPVTTVDTTGAGDCFNAGFLFGWLRDEEPVMCLEIGNLCGALSTRRLGGVDGFPGLIELMELVQKQRKE